MVVKSPSYQGFTQFFIVGQPDLLKQQHSLDGPGSFETLES